MNSEHRHYFVIFTWIALLQLTTILFADEASTAARFEKAKATQPQLIAFVKNMPKGADLHMHISGAVYGETLLDAAIRSPLFFDTNACCFVPAGTPGAVPAKDMLTKPKLATQFIDAISMRGWFPASMSGHDHFFATWSHMNGPMDANVMLAEVLARARAQNLQYLEIMASPAPDAAVSAATANPPAVDNLEAALAEMQKRFPALIQAAKTYMDEQDAVVAKRVGLPQPMTDFKNPIFCRYIFSVNRNASNADFFAKMPAVWRSCRRTNASYPATSSCRRITRRPAGISTSRCG